MAKKKYFTTIELAELLGISRVAVFNKIKKGEIKAEKIGRNYLIPANSVTNILDQPLGKKSKKEITSSVKKVIDEYGETIRKLAND